MNTCRLLAAVALFLGGVGLCAGVKAATEVGAIIGSFAVSPTGAATYSIPITLPPGIGGLAPKLALVYDSQMGNSLAGFSWSLSGLSVITVCNQTVAQDGINQGVSFAGTAPDTNDYCLDGAKLKPTAAGAATYRKELDDFSQITAETSGGAGLTPTSGPQWFEVQMSGGLVYEYGKTADSEIVAAGPGVTMVRAWALDKIYDQYGNSISFSYLQDTTRGDYWPVQITYTNHGSSAGLHTIAFKYTSLTSISPGLVWTSYLAGALISQTQRLNEIDVDYNGTPTFTYTLSYTNTLTDANSHTGTERSLLHTITECAGSTCYPATTIQWQDGQSGWQAPQSTGAYPDATHAAAMHLMDVSGDGRADIVYPGATDWMVMLANGSGFDAAQDSGAAVADYQDALVIDFNGNGTQDLIEPTTGSNPTWEVVEFHVSGTTVTNTVTVLTNPATGASGNATVVDLDGDGLDDLVYSDGNNVMWLRNTGGSFASPITIGPGLLGDTKDDVITHTQFAGSTPDFEGNGAGGIALFAITFASCTPDYCPSPLPPPLTQWKLHMGTGAAFRGFGGVNSSVGNLMGPVFVDFNGDGLSDVLYENGSTIQSQNWNWEAFQSDGAGLTLDTASTATTWTSNLANGTVVDYTGNGREQVLGPLFLGSNETCPADWGFVGYIGGVFQGAYDTGLSAPACNGSSPNSAYVSGSLRSGDVNGDGLTDLVWAANGTWFYQLHNPANASNTNPADVVTTINNNFSQTYTINYAALSDGAAYTPGTSAAPPVTRNYNGPLYVVTTNTANDGVGGVVTDSYAYSGAEMDTHGRGFLGFSGVTAIETRTAGTTVTDTTYNQTFPSIGAVAGVTLSRDGNQESAVTDSYSQQPTFGGATYPYLAMSIAKSYELGASGAYRTAGTQTTPSIQNGLLTQLTVETVVDAGDITNPFTALPQDFTSTTTTNYNTGTAGCLDLPSASTTTRTNSNDSLTRSVSYSDDTQHCHLTGNSVSVTDGSTTQTLATSYTYDPSYGNLQQQTVTATSNGSPQTFTTSYSYDPTNTFVASVTNALNETSTAIWDPTLGVELSATDPNGVITEFGYDAFGLRIDETLGDGTSITSPYSLCSTNCGVANGTYSVTITHLSTTSDPGKTETTIYDSFGRPLLQSTYVVSGALTNVATAYDSLGRVTSVSIPYEGSPTAYTYTNYDFFNRVTAVYSPAGLNSGCSVSYKSETTCETSYAYNGLTASVTDPKGNTTSKTVDALGEVLSVTDAAGGITSYTYYAFGDLKTTTDAARNQTSMVYDNLGRKLSMTDPDMGTWYYGYDPRGLLTSQTDPKNQNITMQYDALGRLINRTEPLAAGGTGTDTWIYDGPNGVPTMPDIGKLVEVQGADGYVKQYQYDSAGRPLETDTTISDTTYATNTAYDTFGRVASVTYPATPVPDADDPPVAVVGPNQAGVVGQTMTLDGSGSYDPDHGPQPLTYKWVQTSGPAETSADGATTATASFSITTAGTYDFMLTVSDGELTNSASTSVTLTPAQVIGLSASTVNPGNGDFTLSWAPAEGAAAYSIEQSTNGGGYSLLPQSYSGTSAGLNGYPAGNYSFAVQGCGGSGNSVCGTFSNPPVSVSVQRTPGVVGTPGASPNPVPGGTTTLSWSKPSGTVSYYTVYKSVDGGAYDGGTNVGNVTSYNETGLTSPHTDAFEVAACNSAACSAPSSAVSVRVNGLGVPWAPSLSSNTPTITAGGTVTFNWVNNGGSVSYYSLQRTDLNSNITTTRYTGSATTYSEQLNVGNDYFNYKVEDCNSYGCSAWSNTVRIWVKSNKPPNVIQAPPSSTAPAAASGAVPASGEMLEEESAAPARTAGPVISSHTFVTAVRAQAGDPDPAPQPRLLALRGVALQAEVRRLARRQPAAHPTPQPLYAAEVETRTGGLLSVQAAVASGLLNPSELAAHLLTTTSTSRDTINFVYDSHGNLNQVVDAANPNLIYWQATSGNAFGQITGELLGNGVINTYGFDPNTGALATLQSGVGNSTSIANMSYAWDADGNLGVRTDNNANLTETLTNDSLNRLTQAQVTGAANSTQQFSYDALGNLQSKTGVGTYNYTDAVHPQQITSIIPPSGPTRTFSYDPNGNITNDGLRTYSWDALNRSTQMVDSGAGSSIQIAYTPSGARYLETTSVGASSSTLTEVNALFEVLATSTSTVYREMIVGGNGIVAIRSIQSSGILTTRYITGDHLGGVSEISNEVGGVVERMSYDAFGARRNPTTWQPYSTVPDLTDITDKGYTGQQQLDAVGLIHMNGRVYDPGIGRFISADPTIPDPFDSQSFNRYAYVDNNSLSMTDPSGFDPDAPQCPDGASTCKRLDGGGSNPPPETGSHIPGVDTGATCEGNCGGWNAFGPGGGTGSNSSSDAADEGGGGGGSGSNDNPNASGASAMLGGCIAATCANLGSVSVVGYPIKQSFSSWSTLFNSPAITMNLGARGCKKVCVNGQPAGYCRYSIRSDYDRFQQTIASGSD
ncbi:MAG: toxin TcdB middle/N-terminal domain-containing protein [Gammaproteobacteria bacterium]